MRVSALHDRCFSSPVAAHAAQTFQSLVGQAFVLGTWKNLLESQYLP
jgi:hypothetical protein